MAPLAPSPRRRTALVLALVVAMAAARPLGGEELGREASAMPRQPTGRRIPARLFCACSLRLAGGGEPKKGKRRKAGGAGRDPAGTGGTRERGPSKSKARHAPDAGQVDSSAELDDLSDGFFDNLAEGGKGGLSSQAKKSDDLASKSDTAKASSKPGRTVKKGGPAGDGDGEEGDAVSGGSQAEPGSSDAIEVGKDEESAAEVEKGGEKEKRKYSVDEQLMAKLRKKQFRVPRHLPPPPLEVTGISLKTLAVFSSPLLPIL